MPSRLKARHQSGDTIVEVLIAIAVVGSVLGITYSIMNRNLLTMRDNQERTEAVKLAQGQVEALKTMWSTEPGRDRLKTLRDADTRFCINSAGATVPLGGNAPHANSAEDDFTNYHPEAEDPLDSCQFDSLYHVGILPETVGGNERHRIYVRWDKLASSSSSDKNEVIITYRVK